MLTERWWTKIWIQDEVAETGAIIRVHISKVRGLTVIEWEAIPIFCWAYLYAYWGIIFVMLRLDSERSSREFRQSALSLFEKSWNLYLISKGSVLSFSPYFTVKTRSKHRRERIVHAVQSVDKNRNEGRPDLVGCGGKLAKDKTLSEYNKWTKSMYNNPK